MPIFGWVDLLSDMHLSIPTAEQLGKEHLCTVRIHKFVKTRPVYIYRYAQQVYPQSSNKSICA